MHFRVHNSMCTFFQKKIVFDTAGRWRHLRAIFDPLGIDLSQ